MDLTRKAEAEAEEEEEVNGKKSETRAADAAAADNIWETCPASRTVGQSADHHHAPAPAAAAARSRRTYATAASRQKTLSLIFSRHFRSLSSLIFFTFSAFALFQDDGRT